MGVVSVQEDGKVVFLAQTLDKSRNLGDADELAFAFGNAHDDRQVLFASRLEHGFEGDEFWNVEMANRRSRGIGVLQNFKQG
jgi:hypothetical protein